MKFSSLSLYSIFTSSDGITSCECTHCKMYFHSYVCRYCWRMITSDTTMTQSILQLINSLYAFEVNYTYNNFEVWENEMSSIVGIKRKKKQNMVCSVKGLLIIRHTLWTYRYSYIFLVFYAFFPYLSHTFCCYALINTAIIFVRVSFRNEFTYLDSECVHLSWKWYDVRRRANLCCVYRAAEWKRYYSARILRGGLYSVWRISVYFWA